MGLLLLKMENIVSNSCINELVEEFHFLTASASGPVIKEIILSTLRKHGCTFEDSVISELVKDLCQLSPVCAALRVDGPFSSKFRREQFSKEYLSSIEPVEYILDSTEKKSFQYIPNPPNYILGGYKDIYPPNISNPPIIISTCEQQPHSKHNITKQKAI